MKKSYRFAILAVFSFWTLCFAEIGDAGFNAGVGVRALSFANNHVAAANDLSAVYWNPAALALLPVREFQISFDGVRIHGNSKLTGQSVETTSADGNIERLRLSGAGAMTAIPTVQGGLTLAISLDRPFMFDDITSYTYDFGQASYTSKDRRYGDLSRWSGAFGVQVTEQISAGLTISILTGKENASVFHEEVEYDVEFENNYLGYTLTGGLLYYPTDILKIGMRINTAMDIGVKETQTVKLDPGSQRVTYPPTSGRAYCAPNGTVGAAVTFPWLIAAFDVRVTMPYSLIMPSEDIPEGVQAGRYKFGAGLGVEVPLPTVPVVFRAGYSLDEHDLFPIIQKFEDMEEIDWERAKMFSADGFRHTVAVGVGVFSSGLGFEASYGYQAWGVKQKGETRALAKRYNNHRVAAALIYRY
jgi:hypothetical protein